MQVTNKFEKLLEHLLILAKEESAAITRADFTRYSALQPIKKDCTVSLLHLYNQDPLVFSYKKQFTKLYKAAIGLLEKNERHFHERYTVFKKKYYQQKQVLKNLILLREKYFKK